MIDGPGDEDRLICRRSDKPSNTSSRWAFPASQKKFDSTGNKNVECMTGFVPVITPGLVDNAMVGLNDYTL